MGRRKEGASADEGGRRLGELLEQRARALRDAAVASGGEVSRRELAELERLARLEQIYGQVQRAPRTSRWPVAAVLAATLVVVSVLLFARVRETEIELRVTASDVGFTLRSPQRLIDLTVLSSLGASGLRQVEVPGTSGDRLAEDFGAVLLAAADEQPPLRQAARRTPPNPVPSGTITLAALAPPAGTEVRMSGGAGPAQYRLSLRKASMPIEVAVQGPIRVGRPGAAAEVITYGTPRSVMLVPDEDGVDLDLGYPSAQNPEFSAALGVSDVLFRRVDEMVEGGRTIVRTASTVLDGTLYFESLNGREYKLRPAEGLRFESSVGEVRSLRLADGHVDVAFRGKVRGMTIGTEENRRSLMPTYLDWLTANHALSLIWGTALYVSGLALAVLRWWKGGA